MTGCKSYYYVYDVELTHPINSSKLFYENDTFSISFQIEPKDIAISVFNKTDEGIKINWDDISISVFGNAFRIVHKETSYMGHTLTQPSTTIPPHTQLNDFLIRSSDVSFYTYAGNGFVNISYVFPMYNSGNKGITDRVNKLKGSEINIFLPYYLGDARVSKYYTLHIKDIIGYKKKPEEYVSKTPTRIGSTKVKNKK